MGVVDQAVEDGIGDGGIADDLVPAVDRDLAGDDDRAGLVAVLDDLQEVAALLGVERLRPPVVEDQQVEAGQGAQRPGIAAIGARQRQGGEQPRRAVIADGEVLAAGLVAEGAGEPALADAARSRFMMPISLSSYIAKMFWRGSTDAGRR